MRQGRIAAVIASLLLAAALALVWFGPLDRLAESRTRAAFDSALVTFAVARTLNGVISVAQGTELSFQPAGVGVVLTAGEILDPLNDLVEQFSWLTLLAATSLGVQIVLCGLFATAGANVIVTTAVLLALLAIWWPRPEGAASRMTGGRGAILRAVTVLLFVRFAIAATAIAANGVSAYYLADREAESVAYLSDTSAEIRTRADAADSGASADGTEPDSTFERFGRFLDEQREALDMRARLERLEAQVEAAIGHVVNLIVLYVVETLVLPLGLFVLAWLGIRGLIRRLF